MITKPCAKPAPIAGHICLDLIPEMPRGYNGNFTPGSLLPVGKATSSTGGAVANTGLALHRLSVPVRLVGKIGADLFGAEIRRIVSSELGTDDTGLLLCANETTSYSIVINPPGHDRMFMHCSSANDSITHADVSEDELEKSTLMQFGYPPLMKQMYEHDGHEVVRLFKKAKAHDVTTSLDLARTTKDSPAGQADWQKILKAVLPCTDIFTPSIDELLFMFDYPKFETFERALADGVPMGGLESTDIQQLAQMLQACGAAIVVIKLGSNGLYMRVTDDESRLKEIGKAYFKDLKKWRGYEKYSPCFKVKMAGATGAGDCTIAGFLGAFLREYSPQQALDCALATGACCVEAPDALSGIPNWDTLQKRLASSWEKHENIYC